MEDMNNKRLNSPLNNSVVEFWRCCRGLVERKETNAHLIRALSFRGAEDAEACPFITNTSLQKCRRYDPRVGITQLSAGPN
jgi:hypothetical protein